MTLASETGVRRQTYVNIIGPTFPDLIDVRHLWLLADQNPRKSLKNGYTDVAIVCCLITKAFTKNYFLVSDTDKRSFSIY